MVGFELMLTVIQDFPAHRWILSWWQREPGLNTEQARRSNPSLSRLLCCPRQIVCSIHSLIGEGREKLCKMFTSAIFAMNARQTGTSMLLREQWMPNKLSVWRCDGEMFITRGLSRVVMFGQLQQQQITGRHDAPDWSSRNDDGALGKINNSQPYCSTGRENIDQSVSISSSISTPLSTHITTIFSSERTQVGYTGSRAPPSVLFRMMRQTGPRSVIQISRTAASSIIFCDDQYKPIQPAWWLFSFSGSDHLIRWGGNQDLGASINCYLDGNLWSILECVTWH